MPRTGRIAPGGMVFHVLNRRVDRKTLFHCDADYRVFEQVLIETLTWVPIRICAYCLMPNHFHMVLWPSRDGELSNFMHRACLTHAARWKANKDSSGNGHLYQNRFKSFAVQSDPHYLNVVRYVERNALRAHLVNRAEEWEFSSLWRRENIPAEADPILSPGPVDLPDDWLERVNRPETAAELEAIRASVCRGRPYGTEWWRNKTARALDIESTLRPRGRPKKTSP